MKDIFGLDKGGNDKRLLSSHDHNKTKIIVAGAKPRLVQDASIQYQQRAEARFEVGYECLYWVCGQSQGSLTLNKLIGEKVGGSGMWEGMESGMEAGKAGGNAAAVIKLETANGKLDATGVCQSATASTNVGNMAVQDNSTWSIGELKKK